MDRDQIGRINNKVRSFDIIDQITKRTTGKTGRAESSLLLARRVDSCKRETEFKNENAQIKGLRGRYFL